MPCFFITERTVARRCSPLGQFLPDHLRNDVVLFLTHRAILNCKVFHNLESGFLLSVMLRLEAHFHVKDDIVVTQHRPVDGMYFVAAGAVAVLCDGDLKQRLAVNDSFAEEAMLHVIDSSPYTVAAEKYCELSYLSRNTFCQLLLEFPSVFDSLHAMRARARSFASKRTSVGAVSAAADGGPEHAAALATSAGGAGGESGGGGATTTSGGAPVVARRPVRATIIARKVAKTLAESVDADDDDDDNNGKGGGGNGPGGGGGARRKVYHVRPEAPFAFFWHTSVLIYVFYNVTYVTFTVAFMEAAAITPLALAVNYIGDVILIADIVLRARYFAFWQGDVLRKKRGEIWAHFVAQNFTVCQVVAALPLEVFYPALGRSGGALGRYCGPLQRLTLFRLNKLLRIVDLNGLADHFQVSR